ncbi:hypothetical protein Lesp02_01280 [Lentzea sp. NBRC 105346]|uniref:DUF2157 domain-containing protein n=1 Tax=Lentzea sp. NBRC 105346 TaxID=3032205 RepID=UPI0024A5C66E|nr:DUF2157 domain-containing protein [Lentzea sp. NBRC 105346]GLZ27938.1 hypothetical protein Lesp02_01280 [Lentzea sp. NBRC 105346]
MPLNAHQQAALRDLTTRGVLSADQELAVREALEEPGVAPRHRIVELLGYLGGGLLLGGAALLLGTSWEDLSRTAKVALLGTTTVVLVVAGLLIAGGPARVRTLTHQRGRVVSTLFALAAATAAFTGGVAYEDHEAVVGGTTGLVVAIAGYVVLPTVIAYLAVAATAAFATGAWVTDFVAETPVAVGIALFTLGVLGMGLAIAGVLRPVPLAIAIGGVVALFGAQQPLAGSDTAALTYSLTAALAVGCFAAYFRFHSIVLLVAGVVATTIAVPEAVWDWTDGVVGGGALLLVAGAVLLAASGIGMRLRRTR